MTSAQCLPWTRSILAIATLPNLFAATASLDATLSNSS
jgi:hypothetical protein